MVVEGGDSMLRLNRTAVPDFQFILYVDEFLFALQPLLNLLGLMHIAGLTFLQQLNHSPQLAV